MEHRNCLSTKAAIMKKIWSRKKTEMQVLALCFTTCLSYQRTPISNFRIVFWTPALALCFTACCWSDDLDDFLRMHHFGFRNEITISLKLDLQALTTGEGLTDLTNVRICKTNVENRFTSTDKYFRRHTADLLYTGIRYAKHGFDSSDEFIFEH